MGIGGIVGRRVRRWRRGGVIRRVRLMRRRWRRGRSRCSRDWWRWRWRWWCVIVM